MVSSTSSGCEYLDFIKWTSSNAESQQPDGKEGVNHGIRDFDKWGRMGSAWFGPNWISKWFY
jgi:hypothetical protein